MQGKRSYRQLVLSGLPLANPHVGQGVYTLRLIKGLAERLRDNVLVLVPAEIARPADVREENFLSMGSFSGPRQILIRHALESNRVLSVVKRDFPEAVFHSPGPISGLTRPKRTVVTLHDCLYRHFPNYDGKFRIRRMMAYAAERFAAGAQLILTDSDYSRRDLVENAGIPESKIEVLYPWVGSEFTEPVREDEVKALPVALSLPDHFWLYLGGFDYRKNIDFLIAAYAEAASRRSVPPLVLAGKVPARKHIAHCDVAGAIQSHGLTKGQVICPGAIPASSLPSLYRAASLLIYPSLMEGFGLPPAEAMAVGTPVLCSNASSLPEVVLNPDCLFDPQDKGALVEKLLAAADGETRFRAELSSHFSEETGITRYLDLINRLP